MVAVILGNPLREPGTLLTDTVLGGRAIALPSMPYVSCDASMGRRLRYGSCVSSRYRWSGYLGG